MTIQNKIEEYILDPDEPTNSFAVGYEYELIGQYASAMGYYLKCAELTDDDKLAYECLLRKAHLDLSKKVVEIQLLQEAHLAPQ